MSKIEYSRTTEWELVNDSQDVRGWPVIDERGKQMGRVSDFIVDTERERVSELVLDNGTRVATSEARLGGDVVLLHDSNSLTGRMRGATDRPGAANELRIPLVEEQLRIGKRTVEGGGVRVTTRVKEKPVNEEVTLREEHLSVERRQADLPADRQDLDALKEGTIDITERAEQAVVDKQARVVEEVVIRKDVEQHTEEVNETLRRTDVDVEKLPARERGASPSRDS